MKVHKVCYIMAYDDMIGQRVPFRISEDGKTAISRLTGKEIQLEEEKS